MGLYLLHDSAGEPPTPSGRGTGTGTGPRPGARAGAGTRAGTGAGAGAMRTSTPFLRSASTISLFTWAKLCRLAKSPSQVSDAGKSRRSSFGGPAVRPADAPGPTPTVPTPLTIISLTIPSVTRLAAVAPSSIWVATLAVTPEPARTAYGPPGHAEGPPRDGSSAPDLRQPRAPFMPGHPSAGYNRRLPQDDLG